MRENWGLGVLGVDVLWERGWDNERDRQNNKWFSCSGSLSWKALIAESPVATAHPCLCTVCVGELWTEAPCADRSCGLDCDDTGLTPAPLLSAAILTIINTEITGGQGLQTWTNVITHRHLKPVWSFDLTSFEILPNTDLIPVHWK